MNTVQNSDMTSAMRRLTQQRQLKQQIDTLTREISTGVKENVVRAAGGDAGKLFAIDTGIANLQDDLATLSLADTRASLQQRSLGAVVESISAFGPRMLANVDSKNANAMSISGHQALKKLEAAFSAFGTTYAGQHIFSGDATDTAPLAPVSALVADITSIVTGASSATAAINAIDFYFDNPAGGFAMNIYKGSTTDAEALATSSGDNVSDMIRADAPEVRALFRALSIAAAAANLPPNSTPVSRTDLFREAAHATIDATTMLVVTQGEIGVMQEHIETTRANTKGALDALDLKRTEILRRDPYEAISRFEEAQTRLQALYALTAKVSRLSLVKFLG